MMPSMTALLLLLLPPASLFLAVAARNLARLASWPEGSPSSFRYLSSSMSMRQRSKAGRRVSPEQRDHELRVSLYSRKSGCGGGEQAAAVDVVECAFCLSGVEEGDEVRELRCRHLFHRGCLDRWLARPPATCPLCRCRLLTSSCDGEEEEEEEDSDMVLFMAYVHGSSTWFGSSS